VVKEEIKYDTFLIIYTILNAENNTFSITTLLNMYNVSRSGYYSWKDRHEVCDNKKKNEIEEKNKIYEMFKFVISKVGHVPGKRTFSTFIERDFNIHISIARCAKIMKEMNLVATIPHKDAYKGQATYNHICASKQNYVNRDFKVAPRTVILSDITYLYYGVNRELFYLCTFKDACTCEILGYGVSKKMNIDLIKIAYDNMMSVYGDTFNTDIKVYVHSDQGSQYLSTTFKQMLSDDNFIQSVSRRGNSQDNAPMESFFARLKTAILDILVLCPNYEEASSLVVNYLYDYNFKHYQYSLGGLTPREYYYYCTTGIYSLTEYCGISISKLSSIETVIMARKEEAMKKRERIKHAQKSNKQLRGDYINPINIVKRDKRVIQKQIDGWTEEKNIALAQIEKLEIILKKIEKAESFVFSAPDEIIKDISSPCNWFKYSQLLYVNQMDGLF
jgi:transposase InsO family protein